MSPGHPPWPRGFRGDGTSLLRRDAVRLAYVTASIACDAGKLSAGSAIAVDDFHSTSPPWRT